MSNRQRNEKPDRETEAKLQSSRLIPDERGRVIPKSGTFNRRHLIDADITDDNGKTVNWMLHATKGWRRRLVQGASK